MSAILWPTDISCLSALKNLFQHVLYFNTFDKLKEPMLLLIGKVMSAAHWPSDVNHWPADVSYSSANSCQLLIGQLTLAAHCPNDVSCSLATTWCQLHICQLTSRIRDLRISLSDLVDFWSCDELLKPYLGLDLIDPRYNYFLHTQGHQNYANIVRFVSKCGNDQYL